MTRKEVEDQKKTSYHDDNLIRRITVWSPTSSCIKIRTALLLKDADVHRTTVRRRLVHDFNQKVFKPGKNLA